jgi:hypothetical protein
MIAVSHWSRLLDYLDRMGAPLLIRTPSPEGFSHIDIMHGARPPLEYQSFVATYGYPTLYIDEDLCLGFLSPEQSTVHPLYHCGVYPFAVCSSDLQMTVVFEHRDNNWNVVVYEGLERVDVDGVFEKWIQGQVRQFLLQLRNYDFQLLRERQMTLRGDPLSLRNPYCFSMIS